MRLFEITDQMRALEALEDSGELAPEFVADTLEGLAGDFETKAVAVAKFIVSLEAHSEDILEAALAMTHRAKRLQKRAESIRHYLLLQCQLVDVRKIDTAEIVISRRNNPVAVQVLDERNVPAEFWVQPEPPPLRLDKKLIKATLQSGTDVPGCFLESGERVEIKL